MSGLAGLVYRDGTRPVHHEHRAMAARLVPAPAAVIRHWHTNGAGLAHVANASASAEEVEPQPVVSGPHVLLFDGRLDDRGGLARRLGLVDPIDRVSDARLTLAAFERWGADCGQALFGDFVLVAWNQTRRELVIVTDAFATRPLYYVETSDHFAFATFPRGLFGLPDYIRELEAAHLVTLLANQPLPADASFFRGVTRLPGGHVLTWSPERTRRSRYWTLEDVPEIRLSREAEGHEAVLAGLEQSVRDRVRSRQRVGMLLSGGLDSSAAACFASRLVPGIRGYCSVPPVGFNGPVPAGWYADERPFVDALGRALPGLVPQFVELDPATHSLFDDEDGWFDAAERPYVGPFNRVMADTLLGAARDAGVGVMLHATMGNSITSWSGDIWSRALRQKPTWQGLTADWAHALAHGELAATARATPRRLLAVCPPVVRRQLRSLRGHERGRNKPLRADVLDAHAVNAGAAWRDRPPFPLRLASRIESFEQADQVPNAGLHAQHGIEMRDVTLDRRLVELCLGLPRSCFVSGGISRRVIRVGMRGQLPDVILDQRQRGMQVPNWPQVLQRSAEAARARLDELASDPVAASLLDVPRLQHLLDDFGQRDPSARDTIKSHNLALTRGLHAGAFIMWCGRAATARR